MEQKTPIVYEDIHTETSTAIFDGRIKARTGKANNKREGS